MVLGIESSCDETAAAPVAGDRTIVVQKIASQDEEHAPYGGVVPEIAARAHAERLAPMIGAVLAEGGVALADLDAVAATAGPGLIGGVMVGLVSAKALAMAGNVPLFAVMGIAASEIGVGAGVYKVADQMFRAVRAGLGMATVAANALFASITGSSIASASVFTRIAVPEMRRFGYSRRKVD